MFFSLGVILFILVSGFQPWAQYEDKSFEDIVFLRKSKLYLPNVSVSLIDLLDKMLSGDPLERFTIDQVLMHPWMKM